MKVEVRKLAGREAMFLILTTQKGESEVLDAVLCDQVGADGTIALIRGKCALSDGCREHYLFVEKADENTVLVPRTEYERLLEDSEFLARLQAAGVDNWEGYGEA